MRFVAVTACPTGIAHTHLAAEALRHQAVVAGHQIAIETQGSMGVGDPLSPEDIAAADAVIVAADIHIDPERFRGKPMVAVSTAQAIRKTSEVLADAEAAAGGGEAVPAAPAVEAEPATATDAAGDGHKRFVGITSCPTGIAHTFMAAEGLRRAAETLGHEIKVETQGSVGAQDVLTADEIAAADAVVIAADTKVDLSRFGGKRLYETSTNEALKNGETVLVRALDAPVLAGAGAGGGAGAVPAGGDGDGSGWRAALGGVYQHLMTGVSYMLPFVVAGGLLIAISFAFDIDANDPANAETFAGRLNLIGSAAFALFLPVFAGFIAFSIADRPGLVPGFVGGYLAVQVEAGFLGALLAGFIAGYVALWLTRTIRLPDAIAGLKPVLILPLLSTLVVGLVIYYVIGQPLAWLQDQLTEWLDGLQGSNAVVLGAILGAMMASDMGGPLNKVAYTFAVGLITSGVTEPMAAVMAAGMTPPLGLAVATIVFPNRWTVDEHEAGKPAFVLGLSFITEGAIPFAARDPIRVIPALIVGSATAGALSLGLGAATEVPHGGIFDLFVPGAVDKPLAWLGAITVGTVVTTVVLFFLKRPAAAPAPVDALAHATSVAA